MPPLVVLEMAVPIARPPEGVWPYLVDWEHADRWMREASGFRVISDRREGVGVTVQARIRIAGITTVDPVVVRRWEPPEWFEIEHRGWVKGRGLMHIRSTPQGCYLWWQEALVAPLSWLGWVGMEIVKPFMAWTFRRDLAVLKRLVESEVPG